jgi:hypothetical protein
MTLHRAFTCWGNEDREKKLRACSSDIFMTFFAGFSAFFCIIIRTTGLVLVNGYWGDPTYDSAKFALQ